jgi:hypothetical protein
MLVQLNKADKYLHKLGLVMGVQKLLRLGSAVVWNVGRCLSLRNLKLNLRITQRVRSFIHHTDE